LHELRADQQLGPSATQLLIDTGEISLDELSPPEGLRAMTEQFIHLLEIGGSTAVADALTEAGGQARDLVAMLLTSGHPDSTGLDELDTLAQAQLGKGRVAAHPLAGVSRSARPHGRRKGRH
jgi:hypothetical protein